MATGVNALSAKLGQKVAAAKKAVAPAKKQPSTKPAPKPAPKKKSSGKRGRIMDDLRPKILAMNKAGKSLSAIAKELGLSNSYVWVIARNYKYDPDNSAKKKKPVSKSKPKPAAQK